MSGSIKKTLLTGAFLCVIGLIAGAVGLYSLGFDLTKLGSKETIENVYEITDEINSLSIVVNTADVEFVLSDSDVTKVVCHDTEKETCTVSVTEDRLYIDVSSQLKWYEYSDISYIFGTMGDTKVIVYLPKSEYTGAYIVTNTGDVTIPSKFTFGSISAQTDTGDVDVCASVRDTIWVKTYTGDVMVKDVSAGTVKIETDTGDVEVLSAYTRSGMILKTDTGEIYVRDNDAYRITAESNTGDMLFEKSTVSKELIVTTDTGDVRFTRFSGRSTKVTTNTGDVTGSFRSDKVFSITTNTGKVNVPLSFSGNPCIITTDTGDIDIWYDNGR